MTALSPVDLAVLRVSVLTWMSRRIRAETDAARAEAAQLLKKGDTLAARSPLDDVRIGRVSMSDPKTTATFTDRAAVDAWIAQRYPDKCVGRWEITGPMGDVITALRKHAPHLVEYVTSVPDWAANELLTRAEGWGEPVGFSMECGPDAPPGIAVKTPDGVLTVRLDSASADAAVRAMWDAHLVDIDGHIKRIEGTP
jgi:hypothetical protein